MTEELKCAHCKTLMKCLFIGDFMNSVNAYYCENKVCTRVYLLSVGGFKVVDDAVPAVKAEGSDDAFGRTPPA